MFRFQHSFGFHSADKLISFTLNVYLTLCWIFTDHTNAKNSLPLPRMDLNAVSDEDSLNDNASVISTVSSGTVYDDTSKWTFDFSNFALDSVLIRFFFSQIRETMSVIRMSYSRINWLKPLKECLKNLPNLESIVLSQSLLPWWKDLFLIL